MRVTTLNQYQQLCGKTANHATADTLEKRLLNYALGLNGEAAEASELLTALDPRLADMAAKLQQAAGRFAEHVKKTVYHRHPGWEETKAKLRKELGDNLWYIAMAADVIGATLEEIATENIEKLRKRYPQGFSVSDSQTRKDVSDE